MHHFHNVLFSQPANQSVFASHKIRSEEIVPWRTVGTFDMLCLHSHVTMQLQILGHRLFGTIPPYVNFNKGSKKGHVSIQIHFPRADQGCFFAMAVVLTGEDPIWWWPASPTTGFLFVWWLWNIDEESTMRKFVFIHFLKFWISLLIQRVNVFKLLKYETWKIGVFVGRRCRSVFFGDGFESAMWNFNRFPRFFKGLIGQVWYLEFVPMFKFVPMKVWSKHRAICQDFTDEWCDWDEPYPETNSSSHQKKAVSQKENSCSNHQSLSIFHLRKC